ncbi:C-type lectin domain family 6 member A isoform X2 [Suricata suricatta]|uniref:C-type lectin domain family 6 member A isoform X2 n=1 Tax=Suricata suricatta TaxID=37032 RepID=UPI00115545E5|nr:C-type lectin domain family 6 member A isoform X2 [Suricata suricatta]
MVREGQPQGGENAVWQSQVRCWSVAVISIALLSACFIASCVVTYHLTYGKTGKRLSELHVYHSSLSCFSEGTSVTGNVWACCPYSWKSFGSSCYFISTERNFWAKSEQNCVAMGAHLVVINTEAEQALVSTLLFSTSMSLTPLDISWLNNTPSHIDHISFIHSSADGHMGCFYLLTVGTNAAVNKGVQMSP